MTARWIERVWLWCRLTFPSRGSFDRFFEGNRNCQVRCFASLGYFFARAKGKRWFENTVFIVTADHTSANETKEHQTYRGKYLVPLMIYSPKYVEPQQMDKAVQHIDIFSTVKHIGGVNSHVALGNSLLDSTSNSITHFDGSVYVYTNDSLTLEWNGAESIELYRYKEDPKQLNELSDSYPKELAIMLRELKISIQKYNYRLLNNYFQ